MVSTSIRSFSLFTIRRYGCCGFPSVTVNIVSSPSSCVPYYGLWLPVLAPHAPPIAVRLSSFVAPIGSPLCFGEALQGVRIRDVNVSVPDLHGARFPQPREGPGEGLPVGAHHARELIVGVAGGYHAAAVGRYDALMFAKAEDKTGQPGRYFLSDQIREPILAGGEIGRASCRERV